MSHEKPDFRVARPVCLSILVDTLFSSICTGSANEGRYYGPNPHSPMSQ
jgi:hypothetical protein